MIRNLPAVVEATSNSGVFRKAEAKPFIHPNLKLARSVLQDGIIPFDKVPFMELLREMSAYEYTAVERAKEVISLEREDIRIFEKIFVLPTADTYILTFGSYLVIDEGSLTESKVASIIAHELGHLNNGDSYVKAALWFLGKGYVQEYMSPFGVIKPTFEDKGREVQNDASTLTQVVLTSMYRGSWGSLAFGVAGMLAGKAISKTGQGVIGLEREITEYFHRWDVEADRRAEKWIGIYQYQSYLQWLLKENTAKQFDASPRVRLDAFLDRADPTPRLVTATATPKPTRPPQTDMQKALAVIAAFMILAVLLLGSCVLMLFASTATRM